MSRENIAFEGEGGVTLRGRFYPATNNSGPAPVIVPAQGMSGVKEMYLDDFAAVFAEAGLNALVYDHQNFGDSDGTARQQVDPIVQDASKAGVLRDHRPDTLTELPAAPETPSSPGSEDGS
ncbi:hypothetical protein OHB00_06460 [Streptomyces sp. NBC_00631]|uniref:alpha/beta hydrolase n=1 Tax=Streptomyces sp. NBC_00631 TaxID=2975793 RepID=UPI0030E51B22